MNGLLKRRYGWVRRNGGSQWSDGLIGALGSNQSVQRSVTTDQIHEEGGHAVRCELGE